MNKPMPPEVADELAEHRRTATNWLKLQFASGMHTINTGLRDHTAYHVYHKLHLEGLAALKRIVEIKAEYSTK